MLHIVPILCLIFFIYMLEYRLNKHVKEIDKKITNTEKSIEKLKFQYDIILKALQKVEEKVSTHES